MFVVMTSNEIQIAWGTSLNCFNDGSMPHAITSEFVSIVISGIPTESCKVQLGVYVKMPVGFYYGGVVSSRDFALTIMSVISNYLKANPFSVFYDGSFREFFSLLRLETLYILDGG